MKKNIILAAFLSITAAAGFAQPAADSGSFYLHKFAQNIGKETFVLRKQGNQFIYDISFKFTDRGQPVPLQAKLVTDTRFEPVSLFIKGNTSRFSTIHDSIFIKDKKARVWADSVVHTEALKPLSFPVAGYSPGTVQMVLLNYWKTHGRPQRINMLPRGEVTIKQDGTESIDNNGKPLLLDRFIISGLIWGNEILWTDKQGNLICLITNDAEGDKLEMMNIAYENLLPKLISRAATFSMQLFSSSMKMDQEKNNVIAIVGGKLIDVEEGKHIDNAVILVEEGVISKIGTSSTVVVPAGATVIHAEGKTIVPGLWDMHAHFQQAEWGPAYLAAGVTTVRDCGNEYEYINAIKNAIDAGAGVGPLILKAGIVDGPGDMALGIVRATTAAEAVNVVRMYKNNGYVQIKIYSSVKPDIVKAICDEAHRLGLTVTGHIPQGMTTKAGIDSGMNMINHMQYVYAMMKRNKDGSLDLEDSISQAAFKLLAAKHIVVDATMGVFEMIFRPLDEDIHIMEPNYENLPVPLQQLFTSMGMPAEDSKKLSPRYLAMLNLVKVLHDKGITVVAGTDMGFPGYSLPRELELYVKAGLTPLEALQTATITAAGVMGMDKSSGSLKPGKQASLVIVDADPLTDIRNIRKVFKVIKNGQQYDPHVLHKMVGFAN